MTDRPSLRSLIGILILILGLALYALMAMQAGAALADAPIVLQTIFYLAVGLAWLWPARALLRWIARRHP